MALKAHLETPTVKLDGRRQARRSLRLETSGSLPGGGDANVTVHNISAAGLLLETSVPVAAGEILTIDLPDVGPVGAEVVWQSGKLFGCAFEQALGEAALAAAQLRGEAVGLPAAAQSGTFATPKGQVIGGASFGTRLNRLRRERGLTLAQVADVLGVSKPTVWAWEKGKAKPIPERIDAIAGVLGVSTEDLKESALGASGAAVVQECRERLADAYGVDLGNIRIMIEI